ncbi:tetratricopeptide repeat protein [Desulfococcaceae bacterium HSG8]|nr:tetratricopeptide repeat protein [Desulfococcaceae bacterium HSG8]
MTKKKKKPRKRKTESQKLSLKLVDERKKKIVRLIQKQEFERAYSQLNILSEKLENNPELLADSLIYIAERTSDHEIKTDILESAIGLLGNYGIELAKSGQYEEAIEKFQQVLEINPHDTTALNNYGLALDNLGQHNLAIEKFQQVLKINPDDTMALNSYGSALDELARHEEAIEKFERVLKINPNDTAALNNYGLALANLDQYEEAIEKFQRVLKLNLDDTTALNNYGSALYDLGQHDLAIEKFKQALESNPDDTKTLASYAVILANTGRTTEALKNLKKALTIAPYKPKILFLYAAILEGTGKFEDAISMLEKLETNKLSQDHLNFVHLNLGRLHYLAKSETLGNKYFDLAIENSEDKDAEMIKAAQHILAVRPYSEEAVERLRQITKESPRYAQALKLLSLNLFGEEYFRQFNTGSADELRDTEALARGIYHNMLNEISILKSILYEITLSYQNTESVIEDIIQTVEDILIGISERRNSEKKKVREIPGNDYYTTF